MLLEEIKNIKSTKSDLRKFGITVGTVIGLMAGLLWWKGRGSYSAFAIISAVFLLFGLTIPTILKPLQKAWMALAVILGWFMTRVILSLLFYIVFTIISLISRLFGKQFLDLNYGDDRKSYWIKKEPGIFDKSKYERQF